MWLAFFVLNIRLTFLYLVIREPSQSLFILFLYLHLLSLLGWDDKWQKLFGCKILYLTPSSEHELTYFDAIDLHDLRFIQTCAIFMRKHSKIEYFLTACVLHVH